MKIQNWRELLMHIAESLTVCGAPVSTLLHSRLHLQVVCGSCRAQLSEAEERCGQVGFTVSAFSHILLCFQSAWLVCLHFWSVPFFLSSLFPVYLLVFARHQVLAAQFFLEWLSFPSELSEATSSTEKSSLNWYLPVKRRRSLCLGATNTLKIVFI